MASATGDARCVVISDLHLNTISRARTTQALARLLDCHPNSELVLNGDIFELSSFSKRHGTKEALTLIAEANREFMDLLREHLARGNKVTFVAGNHDAALAQLKDEMRGLLDDERGRVSIAPWFLRRGDVHIEHGHVYDPDNAPLHPLATFSADCEPLGSALMRRFITSAGALEFAHAHETTPVQGLARAFKLYGLRAPGLIARYFATAAVLCWEAATSRRAQLELARAQGHGRLPAVAVESQLGLDALTELCGVLAVPTHGAFQRTFARLYFDAVLAGLAGSVALLRFAFFGSVPALSALLLASGYLAAARPGRRYRGRPCRELRAAAQLVSELTAARRVVFGHTHVEEDDGPYFNLGSFTYCRRGQHPYALVATDGTVTRGYV